MKKLGIIITLLFLGLGQAQAGNVILMIGDGMGKNHLKCAEKDMPLYLTTLPVKGWVKTNSANRTITDSAAAATAYACGQKTNNGVLGLLPDGTKCVTIAEEFAQKGNPVGIYSTDKPEGATPAAFYAHTKSRKDKENILSDKKQADQMDIMAPIKKLSDRVTDRLKYLSQQKKNFFAMFEGARIDKEAHKNRLEQMKKELYDFDYAVMKAVRFAYQTPNTTVIVLADHECGGLTEKCAFTTKNHTGQNIPVYAYGPDAAVFEGLQDNTDIYKKMRKILLKVN